MKTVGTSTSPDFHDGWLTHFGITLRPGMPQSPAAFRAQCGAELIDQGQQQFARLRADSCPEIGICPAQECVASRDLMPIGGGKECLLVCVVGIIEEGGICGLLIRQDVLVIVAVFAGVPVLPLILQLVKGGQGLPVKKRKA